MLRNRPHDYRPCRSKCGKSLVGSEPGESEPELIIQWVMREGESEEEESDQNLSRSPVDINEFSRVKRGGAESLIKSVDWRK